MHNISSNWMLENFFSHYCTVCTTSGAWHLFTILLLVFALQLDVLTCFNWYSPGDWSYAEEELKMNLGKSFLIHGNSIFFTYGLIPFILFLPPFFFFLVFFKYNFYVWSVLNFVLCKCLKLIEGSGKCMLCVLCTKTYSNPNRRTVLKILGWLRYCGKL